MATSPTITIDGKDYALDALTDETKQLLGSIRAVDQEITRLRRQLAIAQTARAAYARNVARSLPGDSETTPVDVQADA
ncbi:MAG: hypothetical protein KDE55_21360 [Novosphingobium sp.]|nr:hypothetical protein [Novosphingobium sp.]